jgi:hypothetical protein
MTNLLDERIDPDQITNWRYGYRLRSTLFHGAQYKGTADTIVQLISPQHLGSNHPIAADSVGRATVRKAGLAALLASQEKNDEHH